MESNRPTILVVDDTESNVDILVELLSDADYEVMVALDGESALEIVKEERVDLILLDIMMPGMDGYDVCRALKSDSKTREIPVIFLTADTSEASIEKAYEIGGNDYVTKPFRPKELLARVHRELQMQALIRELKMSREEMKRLAITDGLTHLYNRRYFSEISRDIFRIAHRDHKALSVIMLDIDHFKRVNDTYGHQAGDEVIRELAAILQAQKRESDIVCRYGGEEFVILLPETETEGAKKVAEKIRRSVMDHPVSAGEGTDIEFTVSLGVAEVDHPNDRSIEEALSRADDALYEAKENGRNRVCISGRAS